MLWFSRLKGYVMKLVKPSMYISGMDYVFKLWQDADTKERGILLLTFSPMFLSMGGFIFTIIYFVLFVLPSYLFSVLGWGILTALFGAGGKYCYKYFTGKELKKDSGVIDVAFTEEQDTEESDVSDYNNDDEDGPSPEAKKKTSRKKSDG